MLPSRKWPLIILHNRYTVGDKMDKPVNGSFIEKWKNADAHFATPTGSNDDWYWLYAAIKFKCLLVTNDEMRDHLFQLLGNDIFPKWKERHQIGFSFDETGPIFHMPPPCFIVIQESEKGHWHFPIALEVEQEDQRLWLCFTRADSRLAQLDFENSNEARETPSELVVSKGSRLSRKENGEARIGGQTKKIKAATVSRAKNNFKNYLQISKQIILPSATFNHHSIIPELEAAEKNGNCSIDFQIRMK